MGILDWLRNAFTQKKEAGLTGKPPSASVRPASGTQAAGRGPEMKRPRADYQKTFYPIKRRFERFRVQGRELCAKIVMTDIIELSNISTGGACIITTRALQPGENVLLTLPKDKVSSKLKCTIIWERAGEEPSGGRGSTPLHKAGLRFSDMDTGTLVRLKDFIRVSGTPGDEQQAGHFRPGPLRFSIFSGEKAMLNYPSTSPVKTISQGGMLVESASDLEPDRQYPMALYLPHNDQPIKFLGRVASRVPRGKAFDIGVQFLQMKEADQFRLRSFIETLTATN
ncbi:MAG: PilZ domain-containing protein [Nitrospirota bacterium]|nr:PilZ domain-containing protein [Nitrospirota bacterium]